MPQNVPFLTVFLSSPGDVAEERILARKIMKRLPNRYVFKGRVGLNVVAWDDPDSTTAMEATLTPQAAINKGLPMPSASDIVIVIFWSRMGTPFTDETDGQLYQSGTHWELLDGLKSRTTKTYIYRRMFEPDFGSINAPDYDARVEQYRRVKRFFDSEMFYKDGQIKMSVHQYGTPSDFEELFEHHFEEIVANILDDLEKVGQQSLPQPLDPPPSQPQIEVIETEAWDDSRSPFPGLRSFTEADADIFFGRSRETDALVQQIKHSRFVAVVGASGSGKSSLTAAGLIPRLRANALPGSKDWFVVTFKPGEKPFEALAAALIETIPALAVDNPRKYAQELDEFATSLQEKPDRLAKTLHHALKHEKDWSEVLLFVDQFEELLTLSPENERKSFAEMLTYTALTPDPSPSGRGESRVRVVLTMRADFYHRMLPLFEEELRNGSFTLSVPKRDALRQMIERPAERAGVVLEDGLVERILDDTGDEPGALALMAYLLDELYNIDADKRLTHAEYDQLGGVAKAIGTRAENIFKSLPGDEAQKEQTLWRVFRELVEVDENGTATRRRVSFDSDDEAVRTMIYAFADARLLTTDAHTTSSADSAKQQYVEVAHEALLREWDRLANWILQKQDDLRLIRQFERDAEQWKQRGQPEDLQPKHEELVYFEAALKRLDMQREQLPELLQKYTEPEQVRLLAKINIIETSHWERSRIGERLAEIGDTRKGVGLREDGLPDIEWCPVEAGEIEIERKKIEKFLIEPFYMSKYLVTYQQFQAFVDASDGYQNKQWWSDFPEDYQPQTLSDQVAQYANYPRDTISWYQAVAFSNWLTRRLQGTQLPHPTSDTEPFIIGQNAVIRLPLEWEWQWAAQGGIEQRDYPWGNWQAGYANTGESGLGERSTAVGMYPHGASKNEMLDMAGNLLEWCLDEFGGSYQNRFFNKFGVSYDSDSGFFDRREIPQVLRGGAFNRARDHARTRLRGISAGESEPSMYFGIRLGIFHLRELSFRNFPPPNYS